MPTPEIDPATVARMVGELTSLQRMALRTAQTYDRLTVAGVHTPDLPVLSCAGNVTRVLVAKGLAAHGGMIGPAKATVLTALGERVRAVVLR